MFLQVEIPMLTEWELTVLAIEIEAGSQWCCHFDVVMPSYTREKIALWATEISCSLDGMRLVRPGRL
jgi:hypothetical protein